MTTQQFILLPPQQSTPTALFNNESKACLVSHRSDLFRQRHDPISLHATTCRLCIKTMYRQSRQRMSIYSMSPFTVVALVLVSVFLAVGVAGSESLPDDATLLKMKVKELKAILQKKGPDAACVACTSKEEYVSRIHETMEWPDVTPTPEATPMGDEPTMEDLQKMFSESQNDERIAELKRQLKEAGIDTSKIFTASGLNRDQILKETEKFEKAQKKKAAEGEDAEVPEGDDETKSDL